MTLRCGFASVIGLPNVGKSTLVNAFVGSKVSIVSAKPQTTRCRILGIAMEDSAQIILMDVPGIFAPRGSLEKAMVEAAWAALEECDAALHLVDAADKNALSRNEPIFRKLPENKPCILILNKIDKVRKPELLKLSAELNRRFSYESTFMISALKSEGVKELSLKLAQSMPEGAWHFDPEQITDAPLRFMAAEITREQIFRQLHRELPYAVLIETEQWEDFHDGSIKISQIIYVRRATQKAIVLGKGGSRIKEIGEAARKEMEELLAKKTHLKLFVKVQENWPERRENFPLVGLVKQG